MNENIIATIPIEEQEGFATERYYYEYTGLASILTQFTLQSEYNLSEEKFMKILTEYVEAYAKYNMFWEYLRKKYLKNYGQYESQVDFNIPAILVMEKDQGGCCSCNM